jgi:hypothetical protein
MLFIPATGSAGIIGQAVLTTLPLPLLVGNGAWKKNHNFGARKEKNASMAESQPLYQSTDTAAKTGTHAI